MSIEFNLNGEGRAVSVAEDTPLLWVIRDYLKPTGTKFGRGIEYMASSSRPFEWSSCTNHLTSAMMTSKRVRNLCGRNLLLEPL